LVIVLHRDAAETLADYRDYNFDMTALTDHLRGQIDQNKNASYFNIDILKYQVFKVSVSGFKGFYRTSDINIAFLSVRL